jgi:hypothetical protein
VLATDEVHVYVEADPVTFTAITELAQTLPEGFVIVVVGTEFTVTTTLSPAEVHPLEVAVTV